MRRTSSADSQPRLVDMRDALFGGAVAAGVLFAAVTLVGTVSTFEARRLLGSILPTIRFLASSVLAAGVTVMALMLTLLSLTYTSKYEFREIHFRRIRQISMLSTAAIVVAVVLLLFLGVPVEEADQLRLYYDLIYYSVTAVACLLGGLLVAVVLMLHRTINGLVDIGHPDGKSHLIDMESDSTDSDPESHNIGV